MKPFTRLVQYYETDMMGITHHSNYIRWMEESRIDYLDQAGFPYREMEKGGIICPVTAVSCHYKKPCTFGDVITIRPQATGFNGVVMTIGYEMTNQQGELICTATSSHAFLNRDRELVRVKRDMPAFYDALMAQVALYEAQTAAKSKP